MKKRNYIATIFAASILLTGCGDFLEPNSQSEFIPEDATSLNELLLGEAYQRNDKSGFNIFLNLLDDDIEATPYQTPVDGFDANKFIASFTWQPDMFQMMEEASTGHTNLYESYYKLILGTNAVIDYLPKVSDSDDNINFVKAQAYALRAFYYFHLVNIFAPPYNSDPEALGVPLKLSSGIEESNDYLARKTVAEVYNSIISDLHTAEEAYLALKEKEVWETNYRTSLPMVQLMLSRTYLYMEEWEKAAEYALLLMENPNFSLLDLNNIPATGFVNDTVEVRNYVTYPTYDCSETIWPYGNISDMFKWTYDYANQESETGERLHAYFAASQSLLESYDDFDLRLSRYIVRTSSNDANGTLMPMAYGKVNIGSTSYMPVSGTKIFGRCLRLSEAYLNYAEAKAMMGGSGIAEATDALNTLREKRFDPEDIEYVEFEDNQSLIEFVREERRRELCFEGHRWFDLRRWGMPAITHTWHHSATESSIYRLEEKDPMYTVPIPDEALELNSSLVQNDLPGKRTPIETINSEN